jgi:ArsR family transcriptional regulator, arsenate/arsenite/antimonite-responsive transcriptional repressor
MALGRRRITYPCLEDRAIESGRCAAEREMGRMSATISKPVPVVDAADVVVESLKFLSDRNRLRILQILSRRESCVCELIGHLDLPQPLVSYHLRRLREAGLVRSRRKAQWVYYSIEPRAWERFTRPIQALCDVGHLPPEAAYGASDGCDALEPTPILGGGSPRGAPWPED